MAKITYVFPGLTNGLNYYGKIYSMNPNGRVNNRADLKVFSAIPSEFPAVPDSYILIDTYTTSQTFTAPEDGWFKIELHGASGNGYSTDPRPGQSYSDDSNGEDYIYTGGGGGGGAYVASIVKLKQGDIVELVCGAVYSDTIATITSSMETYNEMLAKSGGGGTLATNQKGQAAGGIGGTASGGNLSNVNGNAGKNGVKASASSYGSIESSAAKGGVPGHADGNTGGNGAYLDRGKRYAQTAGLAGFFKISRGNTNLA